MYHLNLIIHFHIKYVADMDKLLYVFCTDLTTLVKTRNYHMRKQQGKLHVLDHMGVEWYANSMATSHVMNSPHHLSQTQLYRGSDSVLVRDCNFIPITHFSFTQIYHPHQLFPL